MKKILHIAEKKKIWFAIVAVCMIVSIGSICIRCLNYGIDFVGGIRGVDYLQSLVDKGEFALAFSFRPTTMDELLRVADAGQIMPPKSTWFEPKLRSGLVIHQIED